MHRKKRKLRTNKTEQSSLIIKLMKRGKKFKIIDNSHADSIQIMDRDTRKKRTFSRLDFRRARIALGLGRERA